MRAGRFRRQLTLCLLAAASLARAQDPSTAPAAPLHARDACAVDAAGQQMIDQALLVEIEPNRSLATLLAVTPDAELIFRRRLLDDLRITAAIDGPAGRQATVLVTAETLADALRAALPDRAPPQSTLVDLLRQRLGPGLTATASCSGGEKVKDLPAGWRHCTAEMIALARRAAETDLRRRLHSRLEALRRPDGWTVALLARGSPAFERALRDRIDRLPLPEARLDPCGVAVQRLILPVADARELLAALATELKLPADCRTLTDPAGKDLMEVHGYGVTPPLEVMARDTAPTAPPPSRPAWASGSVTARATGKPPAGVTDPARARELALTAARVEAMRTLWLRVDQLELPQGTTVGALAAADPEIRSALESLQGSLLPVTPPTFDAQGAATVDLGIRLETIWRTLEGFLPGRDR